MRRIKRVITIITIVGLLMDGCGTTATDTSTDNKSTHHISQEQMEAAIAEREAWSNNLIQVPLATPTLAPTPVPTPSSEQVAVGVTCTGQRYPSSVTQGQAFAICGLITAEKGIIDTLTGCFIDKEGNPVVEITDSPGSSTYNIAHSVVDKGLAFGNLQVGEYTCIISAQGSHFTKTEVIRFEFSVMGQK